MHNIRLKIFISTSLTGNLNNESFKNTSRWFRKTIKYSSADSAHISGSRCYTKTKIQIKLSLLSPHKHLKVLKRVTACFLKGLYKVRFSITQRFVSTSEGITIKKSCVLSENKTFLHGLQAIELTSSRTKSKS